MKEIVNNTDTLKKFAPEKYRMIKIDRSTIAKLNEEFQEEAATIIYCTYVSKEIFVNGGWVNIYPTTYLENSGASNGLQLLHAIDIPIAPATYYFSKKGQTKKFSLYFPTLPKDWKVFRFIEYTNNKLGFTVENIHRNDSGVYHLRLI